MLDAIAASVAWLAVILGYGIVTHGIIFLNDGWYWDGWMMGAWQQNRDRESMRRFYSEVGMPNLHREHWILGCLPGRQTAYRLLSMGSLLITALSVFLIAVFANALNPLQAAIVSLLLLSYPAYAVTFDVHVSLQYTFKVALFYTASLLAVGAINNYDAASLLVFAASLVLFFWSFTANSTLVYFAGFFVLYGWLLHARSPSGIEAIEIAKLFCLAVSPVAYWVVKEKLAPRHGYYRDYNKIQIRHLSRMGEIGARALKYGIDVPMIKPIAEVLASRKVTFFLASLFLGFILLEGGESAWTVSRWDALTILLIGYAMVCLCAAPFVLVGQFFFEGGWASKNFMLFHLPFALIVFGWLGLLPQSLGVVLVPLILLANTLYIVKTHLLYIGISVKDKALIRWLGANPDLGGAALVKIRDVHWFEYPFENQDDVYRPAYLSFLFKTVWPRSRTLAILDDWGSSAGRPLKADEIEQALESTTLRYGFAPQVQPGPQYLVTIAAPRDLFPGTHAHRASFLPGDVSPAKQSVMIRIALKYLYLKSFSNSKLSGLYEQHFQFSATIL